MRTIADTAVINLQTRAFRVFRIVDAGTAGFGVQIFAGEATTDGPSLSSLFPKDSRYGLANVAEAAAVVRKAISHRERQGWCRGSFTLADCR